MSLVLPSEIVVERFLPTVRAMLATRLHDRGLTQQEVADRLGVTHRRLVDEYVDALVDDVRYAVTKGRDPDAAVREAVQDRVPLIIYDHGTDAQSPGVLRTFFDLLLKTATGFGISSSPPASSTSAAGRSSATSRGARARTSRRWLRQRLKAEGLWHFNSSSARRLG